MVDATWQNDVCGGDTLYQTLSTISISLLYILHLRLIPTISTNSSIYCIELVPLCASFRSRRRRAKPCWPAVFSGNRIPMRLLAP